MIIRIFISFGDSLPLSVNDNMKKGQRGALPFLCTGRCKSTRGSALTYIGLRQILDTGMGGNTPDFLM